MRELSHCRSVPQRQNIECEAFSSNIGLWPSVSLALRHETMAVACDTPPTTLTTTHYPLLPSSTPYHPLSLISTLPSILSSSVRWLLQCSSHELHFPWPFPRALFLSLASSSTSSSRAPSSLRTCLATDLKPGATHLVPLLLSQVDLSLPPSPLLSVLLGFPGWKHLACHSALPPHLQDPQGPLLTSGKPSARWAERWRAPWCLLLPALRSPRCPYSGSSWPCTQVRLASASAAFG